MSDSSSKKQKASGGKKMEEGAKEKDKENSKVKKAKEQAAEKERKRIERDRVNQEKEKERKALTERNNLLLQQMTSYLGGRGNEDSFSSDIVSECVDLTTSLKPPPDATRQLEKTITELESVSPHQELTIEQLRRTLATLQRSPDEPAVPPTTPSQYQSLPMLQTATSQVQRSQLEDTPRINTSQSRQVTRPTTGGKCPRRSLPLPPVVSSDDDDEEEVCASCTRLQQRVRELEDQLKSLQNQGIF